MEADNLLFAHTFGGKIAWPTVMNGKTAELSKTVTCNLSVPFLYTIGCMLYILRCVHFLLYLIVFIESFTKTDFSQTSCIGDHTDFS